MGLAFHWFLPTYGDSRNLVAGGHGTSMHGDRPATLSYLRQICAAAETSGFEGVLTPTGLWCEDAWSDDGDAGRGHRDTRSSWWLSGRDC